MALSDRGVGCNPENLKRNQKDDPFGMKVIAFWRDIFIKCRKTLKMISNRALKVGIIFSYNLKISPKIFKKKLYSVHYNFFN